MPIDYPLWLNCVSQALDEIESAGQEIAATFGTGLTLRAFPREGEEGYSSGQLLFERIQLEISSAVRVIRTANEGLITGRGLESQLLFDDLLKRQRKLFESLLVIIMLCREAVWANGETQNYLLHLHLVHDFEHYRRFNGDMSDSFGVRNEFVDQCMEDIINRIGRLPIDLANCTWARATADGPRAQDANTMFLNVRPEATALEVVALGLTYRELFGLSSGQIHFNLSRLHEPDTNEADMLQAIENSTLLSVCLILRLVEFLGRMGNAISPDCVLLRDHFTGVLPNSFAAAVLGDAAVGDLVMVFRKEGSGNFVGRVIQRRDRGVNRYCAYQIEHATGGRIDWFGSTELFLLLRQNRQADLMARAAARGFVSEEGQRNEALAIHEIFTNQAALDELIHPLNEHLPTLYFVQEYLARNN